MYKSPNRLAAAAYKDPPALSQGELPDEPDEPHVRRWPRAARLIFLMLAGAGSWAGVILLLWLLWRRVDA